MEHRAPLVQMPGHTVVILGPGLADDDEQHGGAAGKASHHRYLGPLTLRRGLGISQDGNLGRLVRQDRPVLAAEIGGESSAL